MLNIIIVEDEYMIRNGLMKLIPRLSPEFRVLAGAEDGYEGMQLIRDLKPDLVICDIQMKRMTGLEMIRQLNEANISCRYLILSGYSVFEYAQEAISLGVAGYLLKPVVPSDLQEQLNKINLLVNPPREEPAPASSYSALVSAVLKELTEHYAEDLSLSGLASRLGVTAEYLSTIFAKETGENFASCLKRIRIEKACRLLTETDKKMYEIAFLVGYDNPQYFSNVFKAVTGMSPKSWLRNHGKDTV